MNSSCNHYNEVDFRRLLFLEWHQRGLNEFEDEQVRTHAGTRRLTRDTPRFHTFGIGPFIYSPAVTSAKITNNHIIAKSFGCLYAHELNRQNSLQSFPHIHQIMILRDHKLFIPWAMITVPSSSGTLSPSCDEPSMRWPAMCFHSYRRPYP